MSIELCSQCFGSGGEGRKCCGDTAKIGGCLPLVVDDEGTPVAFLRSVRVADVHRHHA